MRPAPFCAALLAWALTKQRSAVSLWSIIGRLHGRDVLPAAQLRADAFIHPAPVVVRGAGRAGAGPYRYLSPGVPGHTAGSAAPECARGTRQCAAVLAGLARQPCKACQ